jgi:hypothetical protein
MSLTEKHFISGFGFSPIPMQPIVLERKEERHHFPCLNRNPNQSKNETKNFRLKTQKSQVYRLDVFEDFFRPEL